MSLLVQMFSGLLVALTGVCAYILATRLSTPTDAPNVAKLANCRTGIVAAAFTLFYYPFVNWSLQGSEVSGMALIAIGSVLIAVDVIEKGKSPVWLYLLLSLGLLLRADGFVLYAAILGYMVVADSPNRVKHVAIGLSTLVVVMVALTLWRLSYFGVPLPNTYYLKMTGYPAIARISSGFYKLGAFCVHSLLVPLIAAVATIPLLRDRRISLVATVIVAMTAYSVYVGGDAWEWWGGANRYLCVVAPLGAVLLVLTARYWYYSVSPRTFLLAFMRWDMAQGRRAIIGALALAFIALNAAMADWRQPLLISSPPEVAANQRNVEYAQLVDQMTKPSAKVTVTWAGTTPYFCDRTYIDLLGKCDDHIAREPMRVPYGRTAYIGFYPGHLKWDYAYSIGRLKPDLILNVDNLHPDDAPYMTGYGILLPAPGMVVGIRTGSPNIRWH